MPKPPVFITTNDPIRFALQADKQQLKIGDPITLTISAHYLNISPALLFTTAGSTSFRLKVLLPEGFVQTGGDYADYVGAELSASKPTATYILKGYFTKAVAKAEFRLLRGHGLANAQSLFVDKTKLSITVHPIDGSIAQSQRGARSAGPLAFQIVGYDCNSGNLQYQFTGGDGSPINVVLPGIFAGTVYSDNVATHTFPSDARQGRSISGYANQSGNQIAINFTTSCNLTSGGTTNPPPTNPNPPTSGGSLAFQIVSYDCNSGALQYQMTGGDGSTINLVLPGIFAGSVNANNVATHTFPSDARQGRSISGYATQSGNQVSINFTTSCNLISGGTTNPPTTNPNPPASGNCGFTEGQFLFSFYNEQIYAHYHNGVLFAAYQDASQGFKPQHWLVAAGFDPSRTSCFAENDPRSGTVNPPSSGCGKGNGLLGFYTNSNDLSQNLVAVRTDAQLNFTWGGSPIPGIVNDDNFSVRWFGQIEAPVSGNYTFKTNNDDGTRLWINDQLLINDWKGHGPIWQQATIYLTAGQKYDITIDYVDYWGGAQMQLYWEYPGQNLQIVPGCRLYSQSSILQNRAFSSAKPDPKDYPDCNDFATIGIGCAIIYACNDNGKIQEIDLRNCTEGGSGGTGSPDTTPTPGTTPTPDTTPTPGGTGAPGGPANPGRPRFALQITQAPEEASRNKFYAAMQLKGITFTYEEKVLLNENSEFRAKIWEHVNETSNKPDLSALTFNVSTASVETILEACKTLIPVPSNLPFLPQQERTLLGEGTNQYRANCEKWLHDARWATIRTIVHYNYPQATETGTSVANAFKHAMFACYHAQSFGRQLAEQISEAHEGGSTFPDSQMDRWNNAQGFRMWDTGERDMSRLDYLIFTATKNGELLWIRNPSTGQLIPTNQ
ncbi:PA14 domain-containing protein [Spirosoma daeguense]